MNEEKQEFLYTTTEVADMFRVSTRAVREWVKRDLLHPIRTPGGDLRFKKSELDGYRKPESPESPD